MPEKSMTLTELVAKVEEAAPFWDDKVADVLRRYPELVSVQTDEEGRPTKHGYNLGRISAIVLLDFLAWAFDKPHLGYTRPDAPDRSE